MFPSLVRKELYEDDYVLNEQEFKEFNIVRLDPYWKTRGIAYSLSLNIFGTKEQLVKRIQNMLYQNYLHKKPESKSLQEVRETDIEVIVKNLKCSSGQFDHIQLKDLQLGELSIEEKTISQQYPWQLIPEFSKMNKKQIYPEIFKGITTLMRSCMMFYDHFKQDDALTAVVALPYTPQVLDTFSPEQIVSLCHALNMRIACEGIQNFVDVCKQKLLDVYYSVDDIQRLHGVTPCQSQRECNKIASSYCSNNCCKICCQELQNKNPCILHDTFDQFLRNKVKQLYHFEENMDFDKSRTLRIYFRKPPRKHDLEQTFVKENINWNETKISYHYSAIRIQYVYLVFNTQQDAQRVYTDRHIYELKLEKYDCQIQTLSSSLWKKVEKYSDPDTVIAIIRPLSTLDIAADLPQGLEYLNLIHQLIQTITQLGSGDYVIEEDINPITLVKDHSQLFVIVPNREYVDRIYNTQPFLGCILAHKISHIQLLPFKRYHANQCLMCTQKREHNCYHDLCQNCCSRQQYGMLKCPCSYNYISEMELKKEEMLEKDKSISRETVCDKCMSPKDQDCPNALCLQCCRVQAIKGKCQIHDVSNYARKIQQRQETPFQLARWLLTFVGEAQLQLRNNLINADYDWFRPIYNTPIMQSMIKANRDLQDVKDSGSIIRGTTTIKNKRDGKIFTLQANEQVTTWVSPDLKAVEDLSKKGSPFIEYTYGTENCNTKSQLYVKNGVNKYRTYSDDEFQIHINSQNLLNIRSNGFHLLFLGLDRFSFNVKDLTQEIHNRLCATVGRIKETDIMVIDNETIMTDIYTQQLFVTARGLDQNIVDMGRVACIRFENILDSLALLSKEALEGGIKLSLPLANNKFGEPIIFPSSQMIKYLTEFNFNNFNFDSDNGGHAFKQRNQEINDLTNQLQNLFKFAQMSQQNQNNNNNNKKGGQNNRGKPPFKKQGGGPPQGGGGGNGGQQQGGSGGGNGGGQFPKKQFKKNQ